MATKDDIHRAIDQLTEAVADLKNQVDGETDQLYLDELFMGVLAAHREIDDMIFMLMEPKNQEGDEYGVL